jgi:hypothetical protein
MKRPVNFIDKINDGPHFIMNDETFKIEQNVLGIYYHDILWYSSDRSEHKNTDCIWIRPEYGWVESNFLGNYVLLIKIDWENMNGEIVKSPVGAGSNTVPNCNVKFKFTIVDVASLEIFTNLIAETITNNIDILNP